MPAAAAEIESQKFVLIYFFCKFDSATLLLRG